MKGWVKGSGSATAKPLPGAAGGRRLALGQLQGRLGRAAPHVHPRGAAMPSPASLPPMPSLNCLIYESAVEWLGLRDNASTTALRCNRMDVPRPAMGLGAAPTGRACTNTEHN